MVQKKQDILCVLIMFCDQTHCDLGGNLKLEPLMVTLGIFNKELRWKHQAWRTMGYISNLGNIINKQLKPEQ